MCHWYYLDNHKLEKENLFLDQHLHSFPRTNIKKDTNKWMFDLASWVMAFQAKRTSCNDSTSELLQSLNYKTIYFQASLLHLTSEHTPQLSYRVQLELIAFQQTIYTSHSVLVHLYKNHLG